jgi:uncharacterized protein (DUF433 family)
MATVSTAPDKQHVSRDPATCGGKPCIAGTRIRVQDIYIWHDLQSQSVDEIVTNYPQLSHADVVAALAYFWDHREEMLADIQRQDYLISQIKTRYPSKLPR